MLKQCLFQFLNKGNLQREPTVPFRTLPSFEIVFVICFVILNNTPFFHLYSMLCDVNRTTNYMNKYINYIGALINV